ncbi:MAG: CO dehydrogenase/acetyl-CoA synthase complex subunit epsilon [Methanocalculus sp. MSAO_Arc1]|uniref:CO dehydrogenase/acetyl-CoA synthase complex subunit alpha n=1 Tax=Methanocalculus TaxID=71151 RepID=UPI000FF0CC3D|nr:MULTISPECIES: CO dehydrogenase/acetyl-CoA synthase complex subunit alpha [unclassified Methanocalculus]MCP1662554.1 acetyl-CoA decarbonylase/synthase complex subunit alpha [Methanocalculus sp. AMF5]RQD80074.1 MAG: CO dehydrogenase/acetyl-CoA synthase complex subunit epsilon [Methanocalculus sp. MSAO_Arc1]
MGTKEINISIKELETELGQIKDLRMSVGRLAQETWDEPQGPTPFPSLTTLRNWDLTLLNRYRPFYLPLCDLCCLCTYGKCDLTGDRKGACGISMPGQQSRIVLLAACIGAATHMNHAREMVTHLVHTYGDEKKLDPGGLSIKVEAPITRLVCGMKPETLGDLEAVLDYAEQQIGALLACTHTGQEGNPLDLESKVFHTGMIDHLSMEVADIAQVSAYDLPKADPDAPLVEIGYGSIDTTKPVILVIGHNVVPSVGIMDYMQDHDLTGELEVAGICCTGIDMTRYSARAKIVGPISWQIRYIRSGIPDIIVVDEQCIRTDVFDEARVQQIPVIATSEKNCLGLPDRTGDPVDDIIDEFTRGTLEGALILDPEKVGEIAVRTATINAPKKRKKKKAKLTLKEGMEEAKKCTQCRECRRACPNDLHIPDALKLFARGDSAMLAGVYDACVGCIRCEQACSEDIDIHSLITLTAEERLEHESYKLRSGRGAIQDIEIRQVGGPIVLGEIPGIVAFVGCANYPSGGEDLAEMAMEFANRRFIICTSGCAAMTIGMYRDADGKSPYELYPGNFEAGGIVNVGSCVSNSHIAGAAIKIASIFARRNLRGNYEEIADYVHNRVGAVGVAWGAMSQKAAAIAAGFWRLGIPVIVGPHGTKYRRMLLGRADRDEDWYVTDARTNERIYVGPVPEHLFISVETKEEAMVMIAKLSMRPNDTSRGRALKLTHYIDLHRRLLGSMPADIHRFVRMEADIPITMKEDIVAILKEKDWKETVIPDPTLIRKKEVVS